MFKKMFSKAKNKLVDKLLEKKLKDVPVEQREMIKNMVQKDPELFQKIAKEIEAKKKEGMNETHASMQVMTKYKAELQKLAS
jgi:adenylate kinase